MASRSDEIWGTWEDLVVAKLVARDGPRWNIVAAELRARVPAAKAPYFNPQNCQQRFSELRRQFAPDDDPDIEGGVFPREIPWTEDLRILRIDQLRRELENDGVSMSSMGALGVKAKKMIEERERKLKEKAASRESDLKAASGGSGDGDPVSGDNSQSKPSVQEAPEPATAGDEKAASCNGSTETMAKGDAEASLPADAGIERRRELADSAAQSKEGEGDKENSDVQSSVSLSKGRRRKRRSKVAPDVGMGDAGELSQLINGASQPLMAFLETVKSHDYGTELERVLLNQVMKFIKEEFGSMIVLSSSWGFGNRYIINDKIRIDGEKLSYPASSGRLQERVNHSRMIRRPVDMDMVRAKLAGGNYSSQEFCRDLLVLCTNFVVVFPKASPESMAAVRLRNLILIETNSIMEKWRPVSQIFTLALAARPKPPPSVKQSSQPLAPKTKLELEVKRPSQLTACKKRSSISAKPAVPLPVVLVEKDENPRPDGDRKDSDGDDEFLAKKLSGTRRVRTTKNRGRSSAAALKAPIIAPQLLAMPPALAPAPPPVPAPKLSPASGENRPTQLAKPQKKSGAATSSAGSSLAKKRGAATFLNRIKEKSPPPSSPPPLSNTNLLESLKGASSSGYAGKGPEMKMAGEKREVKKEPAPRPRPSGKAASEKGATVKRSVGRPPKRAAPSLTPPPAKRLKEGATLAPLPVKRVKEEVSATASPPPLKRVKEGEAGSSGKAMAAAAAAAPPPTKRVKEGEGGSGSGPTSKLTAAAAASAPPPVKRACPPPLKRVKEDLPVKRIKEEASASTATAPPPVKRVCPPLQKRPREEGAAAAATAPPPAKRVCPPPVKRDREEAAAALPPLMKVKEERGATAIPPLLKRVKEEPTGSSKRGEAMSASKKKGRK